MAVSFDLHIGIDYSGARTPTSRLKSLQVYVSTGGEIPQQVRTPAAPEGRYWGWTRQEIAEWLVEQARSGRRFIAGIDHGFSFPVSYFHRYGLTSWEQFLDDFVQHWPTHEPHTYVDFIRDRGPMRTGRNDELRITETWTSSAKSVFRFDVQGQVAKSTHSGIPWLRHIRNEVGDEVHFWPFDGWDAVQDRSVIAEVYPSIFRNRYPREDRSTDQQDAYAIARWLSETGNRELLGQYFQPPLTDDERRFAMLEGWILGIA
jgi:hypothetical protein